jgi:hypothetical protein
MAKLVRVEFMRRDNGDWMAYEKYDDGSEQGGPTSREAVEAMIEEMFKDE